MAKLLATPRYTTDMRDESARALPAESKQLRVKLH